MQSTRKQLRADHSFNHICHVTTKKQFLAARKQMREAQWAENRLECHATVVANSIRQVYGLAKVDTDALKAVIAPALDRNPFVCGTKEGVAAHEVGHLVAFHVAPGVGAWRAEIKWNWFGWGGVARPLNRPIEPGGKYTAEALLHEARIALAGPVAEELIAGGNALSSMGELVEGRFLAAHAAVLVGCSAERMFHDVLLQTVELIEVYRREVSELAGQLSRGKEITCSKPRTKRILSAIRPIPFSGEVSGEGRELAARIATETPSVSVSGGRVDD